MLQFMKKWYQAFKEDKAVCQEQRALEAPIVEPGYAIMKDLILSSFDEDARQKSIRRRIEQENHEDMLKSNGRYS